jgi:hypothetical protein
MRALERLPLARIVKGSSARDEHVAERARGEIRP